jgi:hypothetical protein
MSAYHLVNGVHCGENPMLLTNILKKEFGFKGFVISDCGSTYSTAPTVNAGMDLGLPVGRQGGHALASILFGDANPSAGCRFPSRRSLKTCPASANYPGVNLKVNYAEVI